MPKMVSAGTMTLFAALYFHPWTEKCGMLPKTGATRLKYGELPETKRSFHFASEGKRKSRIQSISKMTNTFSTLKTDYHSAMSEPSHGVLKKTRTPNSKLGMRLGQLTPREHLNPGTKSIPLKMAQKGHRDKPLAHIPISQKILSNSASEIKDSYHKTSQIKTTQHKVSSSKDKSVSMPTDAISDHSFQTFSTDDVISQMPSDSNDHRDNFHCGDCVCFFTNHGRIVANCTFKYLNDFPKNIPATVVQVNVPRNKITIFDQSVVFDLKKLQTLSVRSNRITKIIPASQEVNNLETLDLSYNRIENIQGHAFSFLTNLKNFSLRGNHLTHINNDTFANLTKLRVLNLASNNLKDIDASAFDPLVDLRELYLHRNIHMGYSKRVFVPSLFDKTKKIKILSIQGDSSGQNLYPLESLAKLKNLQNLNVDIVYSIEFLGPTILGLKNLKVLQFGPEATCHRLKMIPPNFFQYVPYIQVLSFNRCLFHDLDPALYAKLPSLKRLSFVSVRAYPLKKALEDMKGLQNSSLEYLRLSFLKNDDNTSPCVSMKGADAMYLTNITTLKELDLSHNDIALLQNDFLRALPSSLKTLRLNNNLLTLKGVLWSTLYLLKNLKELFVSNQGFSKSNWRIENNDSDKSNSSLDNGSLEIVQPFLHSEDDFHGFRFHEADSDNYVDDSDFDDGDNIHHHDSCDDSINSPSRVKDQVPEDSAVSQKLPSWRPPLPKSLKYVEASYYVFFGDVILRGYTGPNNLEYIFLANGLLTDWGEGWLSPSFKHVDLSKNYCKRLNRHFFPPNNSLIHISMSSNLLGSEFSTVHGGHYFKYLEKTMYIDISLNFIYTLPYTFLKGLTTLETLRMTDNRLQSLNISFSETPNLRMLDVRQNSISWISKQSRDALDRIALKHPITLAIVNNPISCTCGGIDIIKWMSMTTVHLLDRSLLQCRNENGVIGLMGDIHTLHESLQRRCMSRANLIICGAISISFFILLVLCYFVGKRYRWWFYVKYKKNVLFARWFGFKPKIKERSTKEYRFDAYLCYAPEDRQLAITIANKMDEANSLFIPDRHILYGTSEVSGMTSGVLNSYKFLIVLTNNFKEHLRSDFQNSGMLEYTVFTALFEERSSRRQMLHVMQFTDVSVQDGDIPVYIAHVLADRNRLTIFPVDDPHASQEAIDCVWRSLSASIGQKEWEEGEIGLSLRSFHEH